MKPFSLSRAGRSTRRIALVLPVWLGGFAASAQLGSFNGAVFPNLTVPDNSAVGVVSDLEVSGLTMPIASVQVHVSISAAGTDPMFNGDLYVVLSHGTDQAILLNRVGRREGSLAGYADSGFEVTFSDSAAADVHDYRLTLNGSHSIPLSSTDTPAALTGTWQPDGRNVDPQSVTSTTIRTSSLSGFDSQDANGTWSLYLVDLSPGGQAKLNSWSLDIIAVPEPLETGLIVAGALTLWSVGRKRR
ncbi:MAG TPA: hypothetical protein VMB21_20725 [Candidatus Limnocylindria bacterium]|nr:hypothetical protein [Candidatus Limnocylindria bacterium]